MENNIVVIEDGKVVINFDDCLWNGLFSKVESNNSIIKYIQSCIPNDTVIIIPKSDGNINNDNSLDKWHDVNWDITIQPCINYTRETNKTFIIGTLCQIDVEKNCNYLYLPLDDNIFEEGVCKNFNKTLLPKWEERSNELCWRGSCSGIGGSDSIRIKFVKKIFDYDPNTNVRLSTWWSENKNIPSKYFADRINYMEFTKYKIFFIVDGNCIASNHMYGFATGCVPFLISNSICWFSHLIVPYEHYIPINYDLSNLIEQIEWVKNNDEKAKIIAENAYKFAEHYFSSEYQHKYIKDSIDSLCKKDSKINKKIVDTFIFYNELELLYYRLTILNNFVDYFVIIEANHTFAGNTKKLYYEENKYLFKRFESKIIHIVVNLPYVYPNINYSENEQWKNEYYQRNCIMIGVDRLNLSKDDLIIISDLDEIVKPDILNKLKKGIIQVKNGGYSISQDMYYYNLNTKHDEILSICKIVTYNMFVDSIPQKIRTNNSIEKINDGGWHLSYFGDKTFIKNKIKEFSHQELNCELYLNEINIEYNIKNNMDLFDRSYVPIKYISTNENKNLPDLYNIYLRNYIENDCMYDYVNYIYFHICCINNWKDIVSELLFKIKNSGLYNKIKEIKCIILGNYDDSINDPKINIIFRSNDISLAEKCSINLIYKDCIMSNEEFNILYIHSKGVKHLNNEFENNIRDWREYMSYFNIYNFDVCLKELDNCNAVGVNLQVSNDYHLHYSGNFWWSKSSHIRNLNFINDDYYNSPEFWVTSINGTYKSLWNSNTHHYNSSYPYYLYENKPIQVRTCSNF